MPIIRQAVAGWLALLLLAPASAGQQENATAMAGGPCSPERTAAGGGLEGVRAGLERGACGMARFVDGLFGGQRALTEAGEGHYGRVGLALGWNEQDGIEPDGRLRAHLALPALDRRLNAVIGRVSRDEFIADESAEIQSGAGDFSDEDPANWFAGLDYGAHRGRSSRLDLGAGVKLDAPLNPHVNLRYRRYLQPDERLLLTLRSTAFWENHEGFGLTQGFDADRVLAPDRLLRWTSTLRWSEETLGLRWRSRLALYHALDHRRAMRYELFVRGETDGTEPDLYGLRITQRRSLWREWFFVEATALLFWADGPLPADRCHHCPGLSIGFELLFGEAYDPVLRRGRGATAPVGYADPAAVIGERGPDH